MKLGAFQNPEEVLGVLKRSGINISSKYHSYASDGEKLSFLITYVLDSIVDKNPPNKEIVLTKLCRQLELPTAAEVSLDADRRSAAAAQGALDEAREANRIARKASKISVWAFIVPTVISLVALWLSFRKQ